MRRICIKNMEHFRHSQLWRETLGDKKEITVEEFDSIFGEQHRTPSDINDFIRSLDYFCVDHLPYDVIKEKEDEIRLEEFKGLWIYPDLRDTLDASTLQDAIMTNNEGVIRWALKTYTTDISKLLKGFDCAVNILLESGQWRKRVLGDGPKAYMRIVGHIYTVYKKTGKTHRDALTKAKRLWDANKNLVGKHKERADAAIRQFDSC